MTEFWAVVIGGITFWGLLACGVCVRLLYNRRPRPIVVVGGANEQQLQPSHDIVVIANAAEADDDEETTCPVCFRYKALSTLLPCKHQLCALCALRVHKCPLCREPVKARTLVQWRLGERVEQLPVEGDA